MYCAWGKHKWLQKIKKENAVGLEMCMKCKGDN